MELLPTERDVAIAHKRGAVTERSFAGHDGAIIVCPEENALEQLERLPFKAAWRSLYLQAQTRGSVSLLSARLTHEAKPIVVAFLKSQASAFARLTLAARAWKELQPPDRARVLFAAPGLGAAQADALEALLAAALAGSARLPTLKSSTPKVMGPKAFTLIHDGAAPDVARTVAVDRGNHLARWLTTLPPNVLDTKQYRRALKALAAREGWEYSFLDEAALQRRGAGAFLAVAQANAHRDAGIVRLCYRTRSRGSAPRLALVGKGVCFDTGGVNLKPHKSMYQMHEDMQGSAVAVGSLLALSQLNAPFDVDCWLAISENEIGPRSFRPQDVVRASNGVTIQVAHSDAEGRMLLADTLAIAARETPDLMIDFATLTGACVIALGDRYSGAFTNRDAYRAVIEQIGRDSGERVWPFPMDDDYDGELESTIADVLQCTPDSKADHILAARFLTRFVPQEIPWIHLDLAASNRSGGLAHVPTDFTGFGVRFATRLLLDGEVLPRRERRARRSGKLARNGRRAT